jgi:hypothetical protein
MKKLILTLTIIAATYSFASAQLIPSFQFGVKAGANFSNLSANGNNFNSSNQAGYLGGIWARFGALGFNFQPEAYITGKNIDIMTDGGETKAKFTSLDVPLLFGSKIGAFGFGARIYTGPVVSFAINKDQSFSGAVDKAVALNYQDQNFAWQGGIGIDIRQISFDARYEAGITKQDYNGGQTRVSVFSLAMAVKIF